MTQNYNIFTDLDEATKMVKSLEDYLKGNQLYGSVGGGWFTGGATQSLTVGALLMRLRRLHVLESMLKPKQRETLANTQTQFKNIRNEWTKHYTDKLLHEAKSRLDAMKTFFEECAENPPLCPSIYKPEVLRRTIVQEVLAEMDDMNLTSAEVDNRRQRIDGRLHSLVRSAEFVWDPVLQPAYPQDVFWWMYASPPEVNRR